MPDRLQNKIVFTSGINCVDLTHYSVAMDSGREHHPRVNLYVSSSTSTKFFKSTFYYIQFLLMKSAPGTYMVVGPLRINKEHDYGPWY